MARKVEKSNVCDLYRRYLAGETVGELSCELGIPATTLRSRFAKAGCKMLTLSEALRYRHARKPEIPGLDSLLKRYLAGETEQLLSAEAGINRQTFRRRLLQAGIKPRSISDTMYARWGRASKSERAKMLEPCHAATMGRKPTMEEIAKSAKTRESKSLHSVAAEHWLVAKLQEIGLSATVQKAVWIYNIDVAVDSPPIAVEIFGGNWHARGRHAGRFHKRTKYLLNQGWNVLVVWVDGRRYPLGIECIEYIRAFADELRRKPSTVGQYRVILGNAQAAPVTKTYFNTPADIKRLGSSNTQPR